MNTVEDTKTAQKRVSWPDVLRVLPDGETRSWLTRRLRDAGFSPDSFASQAKARATVADALTRIEDRLDAKPHRGRLAIQAIRRVLELEIWP